MDRQLIKCNTGNPDKFIRIENGIVPSVLTKYWNSISRKEEIGSLCLPLKQYGINYLLYVKRFADGSQLEVTTHPEWSEYYYKHEFYSIGPFKNIYHLYDEGRYLWISRGHQYEKLYQASREVFNIDHGYTMVYKKTNCNEFFHFGGSVDNPGLLNFYLNNNDFFERFVLYFKDKYSEGIKKAESKKFILVHKNFDINYIEKEYVAYPYYKEIKKQTPIKKYYLSERTELYLTQREIDCVKWYVLGKTAEEIAIIFTLSKRTVEGHLEKAKKKLSCLAKSQLVGKINPLVKIL